MEKTSEVMKNILAIIMAGSVTFIGVFLVLILFDALSKKK